MKVTTPGTSVDMMACSLKPSLGDKYVYFMPCLIQRLTAAEPTQKKCHMATQPVIRAKKQSWVGYYLKSFPTDL